MPVGRCGRRCRVCAARPGCRPSGMPCPRGACRGACGAVPPPCGRGANDGSSGATRSHNPSGAADVTGHHLRTAMMPQLTTSPHETSFNSADYPGYEHAVLQFLLDRKWSGVNPGNCTDICASGFLVTLRWPSGPGTDVSAVKSRERRCPVAGSHRPPERQHRRPPSGSGIQRSTRPVGICNCWAR